MIWGVCIAAWTAAYLGCRALQSLRLPDGVYLGHSAAFKPVGSGTTLACSPR